MQKLDSRKTISTANCIIKAQRAVIDRCVASSKQVTKDTINLLNKLNQNIQK